MKKIAMLAVFLCSVMGNAFAQEHKEFTRGVFNHVGLNVGVGTEGVSVGVAAPVTNFLEIEAGVNMMPSFKVSGDLDVDVNTSSLPSYPDVTYPTSATIDAEGNFSRTTFNLKANVYPFGGNSTFFVSAGLSFGGKKIAKVSGSCDELKRFADQYPAIKNALLEAVGANLGGYNLKLDDNFAVDGDIRCKSVRPYLGLGFGRLVPKHRVGFRFEMGCQFMGKLKVYQNDNEIDVKSALQDSGDDDLSKVVDDLKFYPVIKFSLVGRIL